MSASAFEVNSGGLSLDSGCFGFRQGSRLCWFHRRRSYLVHKGRGQDHGQSDQEQDDRQHGEPPGQGQPVSNGVDDLVADPRAADVDQQHLPEAASVDFGYQSLET
jgi:hypothetical protein